MVEMIQGNDDQGFWVLAAMTAAEQQLPNPSTSNTTWLDLGTNVFNLQVSRWNTSSCGGGLRWQIFEFEDGYNYKNAISTGTFFLLAARLARFTGNQTYSDWAEKSYDWISSSALITSDFKVYDGAEIDGGCRDATKLEWTYNAAIFLYGSAVMYNFVSLLLHKIQPPLHYGLHETDKWQFAVAESHTELSLRHVPVHLRECNVRRNYTSWHHCRNRMRTNPNVRQRRILL